MIPLYKNQVEIYKFQNQWQYDCNEKEIEKPIKSSNGIRRINFI